MIILSIITALSIILYLTNFTHPLEEQYMDEISKLKNSSPELIKFYEIFDDISPVPYNHNEDLNSKKNSNDRFRIAFDAQHDGQIHYLGFFYFAWNQLGMTYQCYDSTGNFTKIYFDDQILKNISYDC